MLLECKCQEAAAGTVEFVLLEPFTIRDLKRHIVAI